MSYFIDSEGLCPLSVEMSSACLGDVRLESRLMQIMEALEKSPGQSLPKALGDEAAIEAGYRFLRNESVDFDRILQPHYESTVMRAKQAGSVLVLHDTTTFQFRGESQRDGLGWVRHSKRTGPTSQGFFGHFALVVTEEALHCPLGMVGVVNHTRTGKPKGPKRNFEQLRDPKRETMRWHELSKQSHERLEGVAGAVHVMDREADIYELMAEMQGRDQQYVIRLKHNRKLAEDSKYQHLYEALQQESPVIEREVFLSARAAHPTLQKKKNKHPPRKKRTARLQFSARTVTISRAKQLGKEHQETLQANVVRVYEVGTPRGEQPVEWRLITTEPIESHQDIERVVDIYRARWQIEEYFKALKTGCEYQKLQLESYKTLLNALALYIPVAWRLLLLRKLGRENPDAPATKALTVTQVKVLKAISKKPLPKKLTVRQAMLAIAAIGGHLKQNGDPGWIVLGRGFYDLLVAERGWNAALRGRCDQ